jgi:ergothioneine biosynthesis protein EgtB
VLDELGRAGLLSSASPPTPEVRGWVTEDEVVMAAIPSTAMSRCALSERLERVRQRTLAICEPLSTEDYVVQSMPDASPIKWHLAHTTWFFEQFILKPRLPQYASPHPRYEYLFNSYYQGAGPMHLRAERGLITRPTVGQVLEYRRHVEEHLHRLLESDADPELADLVELGLNHEQQHQELMLTDLKHAFSRNPLLPAYRELHQASGSTSTPLHFTSCDGGIHEIGLPADPAQRGFCFDNETPRHRTLLEPFAMASRLISNEEYLQFVRDRGYQRPELWLSDGWAMVTTEQWQRPLYWRADLDSEFTLGGVQALDPAAPVCHVSFYEADAFARWAQARLPTEAEWEVTAATVTREGNFYESGALHPQPAADDTGSEQPAFEQLYGDVWEWTGSPYVGYSGYRPPIGTLGEYNGKFMCNQWVLRGGSCVTPADHMRLTYRNFFYPHLRWQFSGIRLARDAGP